MQAPTSAVWPVSHYGTLLVVSGGRARQLTLDGKGLELVHGPVHLLLARGPHADAWLGRGGVLQRVAGPSGDVCNNVLLLLASKNIEIGPRWYHSSFWKGFSGR